MRNLYKIVVFVCNIFLTTINCHSQLYNSTIKTIYNKAIQTIDLGKIEFKYTDSLVSNSFDFEEFKPTYNSNQDKIYYKIYYKNSKLVKLSRFEESNPAVYEFYFWDFEQYKLYIVSTFFKEDPYLILNNIRGFFIYDKQLKSNIFIGLESNSFPPIFDKKNHCQRQDALTYDSIPDTKRILSIISLDKFLCPINRLNIYKNKFISHSTFQFEHNTFYEELRVYDNSENAIDISKITFSELNKLFIMPPEDRVAFQIGVILNQKYRQTIWADPHWNWGYIYSPKDNKD